MSNKAKRQLKTRTFLHGMVTAHFFPHRNIRMNNESDELEAQLLKALKIGETDDARYGMLCTLLTYTKKMEFNWLPDAPEEWKALEELWNEWAKNNPVVNAWEVADSEAFDTTLFFGWEANDDQKKEGYVDVDGWLKAFNSAMIPWSPIAERQEKDLTKDQIADPN